MSKRRRRFGELVQLDGSDHDWFEGRGERCVAMVMVDDATGWTHGTPQDRLVKAMRLANIRDIEAANAFVAEVFLPEHNARFVRAPLNTANAHVKVGKRDLEAAMCVREDRQVGNDQCISWQNQVLQLEPGRRRASLAGKQVQVVQKLDGALEVRHAGRKVVAARPQAAAERPSLAERVSQHQPAWKPRADHPWKRGQVRAPGRPSTESARAAGLRPAPGPPPSIA